ncbi:MAG: hypothetical protein BroJett011_18120 [Chloroflexota bacterium]|nr:MAG: hypothetical protein BroJett011_18120 [Chloroflexota bacterium]
MSYSAEISRANPGCFLFLIDQSGSMSSPFGNSETGSSKAEALARAINRLMSEIVIKCSKDMEIRRYFQVGVIGYGNGVGPVLGGNLVGHTLVWVDQIYENPVRVESITKKVPDGAGGLVDSTIKFPVWFDPVASGGTPMNAALSLALITLQSWVVQHPSSFPPIVINITDGESTDGDPSSSAAALRTLETNDGNLLLLNLHLSSTHGTPILFPDNEQGLPDQYARQLFRMSSQLPDFMQQVAREFGYNTSANSWGFAFNAEEVEMISFLNIGTRPSNMR